MTGSERESGAAHPMTEGEKMEACPFCGGTADPAGWLCNDGTSGPECTDCGATATNIAAWNRRPAPSAGEVAQRLSHPVFAFLLGEGPLNGLWFGDAPPKKAGVRPKPHWWRAHLRAALTPPPPTGEDA